MSEPRDPLASLIAALKEPARLAPDLTTRVMVDIATLPPPQVADVAPEAQVSWWRRRWTVRVSPLGALAAAACLTGVFVTGQRLGRTASTPAAVQDVAARARVTQFMLVAPNAQAVSVVGDFNDWSLSATPLVRADSAGVWWVTVPLGPGRYRYAFVVDGTIWQPDPEAPAAEDDFGRPNSVLTIGGA